MHLSEIEIITGVIERDAKGAIIAHIRRSRNGTLFQWYGAAVFGLFFSTTEKMIFPVSEPQLFPREEITNLEEALRKYIGQERLVSASIMQEYGKVVVLHFRSVNLVIPLFPGAPVSVRNDSGELWSEKKGGDLPLLKTPLRHIEPAITDPYAWQRLYAQVCTDREEAIRQTQIAERRKYLQNRIDTLCAAAEKSAEKAKILGEEGELLRSHLYLLGADSRKQSVTVYDFAGAERELSLDNRLTVAKNMDKRFAEAKRQRRGAETTARLIAEAEAEMTRLATGDMPPAAATVKTKGAVPEKKNDGRHTPYYTYISEKSRVFLAGKSSVDNDELTFRVSSPHDLWFHAKEHAGSHIVLRKKKGEEITGEELLQGAALALFYSKARTVMEGEVWYCERKFVTKKKGMSPGKVLITQGKSIYLRGGENYLKQLKKEEGKIF